MKPRTSYLWILFLFAIVLAGCSSTDPMKSTAIRMELDQLEDKLRASNEPEGILTTGAGQDTVFIAGYPEGKIEVEGRSFTVFTLADADYSPGSMGSTYTTFDSRTGAMITHTTPPTNAGIHLGTGDAMFALEEDVPILERRWWIFFKKPHLYYFPAAITGSYVPHEGSGLRILEPAPSPSDAKWSPLLPPRLPDHLVDLKGNALFIARRGYDLGSPFAPVPVNFHIGFDHKNTRALYEKILAGEFGADHPWDEDELTRLNRWLSAYPHYQKAEAFLNDEKTPWIVAMDSPTLLRERRLQAGRESLNNAVEHDPQWSEPKDRLVDVDEEEAGLGVADEGHGPTGKRFRIGLGARAILLSESYSAPYEDVESSVNMSMFGHYQVLNDFSLSLGSEAFQAVFSDGDKPTIPS